VLALPSGLKSRSKDIWTLDGSLEEAFCPQSVTICLEDDIDISRGDIAGWFWKISGLELGPAREDLLDAPQIAAAGPKIFRQTYLANRAGRRDQPGEQVEIVHFRIEPNPSELAMNDMWRDPVENGKAIGL